MCEFGYERRNPKHVWRQVSYYAQARKQAEGEVKSEYVKWDVMSKQLSLDQENGCGTGEATDSVGDGRKSYTSGRGPRCCYSCHKYGHIASRF